MNRHERMAKMLEERIRRDFPHMAGKVHVGCIEPTHYTPQAAIEVVKGEMLDPVVANPRLSLHSAN